MLVIRIRMPIFNCTTDMKAFSIFPKPPTVAAESYGFYSAAFANIASGWYETATEGQYAKERDRLNEVWNNTCDSILKVFLVKYGAFYLAWEEDIAKEISQEIGLDVYEICRYLGYYIASRICKIPEMLTLWEESLREKGNYKYKCRICGMECLLVDAHPDLLREHGLTLDICRQCNYVYKRYLRRSPDALELLPAMMSTLHTERKCVCCDKLYNLVHNVHTYSPIFGQGVDMLYVNLYANVCLDCFKSACDDYRKGRKKDRLQALKAYADFLGHIPHRDFSYEILNLQDKSKMGELFKHLQHIRTNNGYCSEYGSFFEALVKARVLPDGTQRMSRGTRIIAKDGDLCYSLKEKEIDDYLYSKNIPHVKEARYPDSNMRADWEVMQNGKRIFIEYFGLIDDPVYAAKVDKKKEICTNAGIALVEIYPDSDIKEKLRNLLF